MINILFGLFLVFFKTNLNFVEIGTAYYLTNIIGYISLFIGIKELGREKLKLNKIKPYIVFMILHSILFFLLNITGNSPLTLSLSTSIGTIISFSGFGFIIVGIFMIFYIISVLIDDFKNDESRSWDIRKLDYLFGTMILMSILATISFIFNFIPMLAEIIMGILLLLQILFLVYYYNIFLKNNKSPI